jgi:hypothetical protein
LPPASGSIHHAFMTLPQAMVLAAVIASVVLVSQTEARLWAVVAVFASGLEALLAFRVIQLSVSGLNLTMLLALALVLAGGVAWAKASSKSSITAATALALVGAIQLAGIWI